MFSSTHWETLEHLWRLLLMLQTSGKKSADKWETSVDEWRRVKTNERPVQTIKDESKTNERRVQTSEDEWETSTILSFMNPESPAVFTSNCNYEIKPCLEDFVLYALIFSFLAIFTGKHLCWSLFLTKLRGLLLNLCNIVN